MNRTTFAVTNTGFGTVEAVDSVTNHLYAVSGNNVQIINGATDVISKSVALSYATTGLGINNALSHLYVANGGVGNLEVRNELSGALQTTFALGANLNVQSMAVDSTRGRIYANVYDSRSGQWYVYVIEDLSNTRVCRTRGSC